MTRWLNFAASVALGILALASSGCKSMPGHPKPGAEVVRPDDVSEFHTLYKQNCAGCHGDNGRNGAAIPLNNPAYLAVAGADNLRAITAKGVGGTLMPAFARSAGGMLTDGQIDVLVQGCCASGPPGRICGHSTSAVCEHNHRRYGEWEKAICGSLRALPRCRRDGR